MTVLHVAAGNTYGGIERMLVTLAATPHPRLQQRFVTSFGGRFERELRDAGASVHRLPSPRALRPLMVWRSRGAFAAHIEETAPDAVIFHGAWPHAMFAVVARAAGRRVGFWQHQPIVTPAWPDRWARRVRPDFIVYNSAFTRARPAFPAVQGAVIHCPVSTPPSVDAATRRKLRSELGASDGDVVVLMAARLDRWKGHAVLLDAARALPQPSRLRLWIAGGVQHGSEAAHHQQIRERASAPDLRSVVAFLGQRDDVQVLMRLADIYCQPNLSGEPFGIAIAEAMRAGLPCVVSAPGGAGELLDESCAIITAPGDAEAIAAALRRLADDAALRARMGRAGAGRAAPLTDPRARLDELEQLLAGGAS